MEDFIEIARKRAVQGMHFAYNDRLRIVVGVTRRESELPAIPWINVFAVDNHTQTTLLFGFETYEFRSRRKSRVGDAGLIDFTRDNYLALAGEHSVVLIDVLKRQFAGTVTALPYPHPTLLTCSGEFLAFLSQSEIHIFRGHRTCWHHHAVYGDAPPCSAFRFLSTDVLSIICHEDSDTTSMFLIRAKDANTDRRTVRSLAIVSFLPGYFSTLIDVNDGSWLAFHHNSLTWIDTYGNFLTTRRGSIDVSAVVGHCDGTLLVQHSNCLRVLATPDQVAMVAMTDERVAWITAVTFRTHAHAKLQKNEASKS